VEIVSPRKHKFDTKGNDLEVLMNLDLLEERRGEAKIREAKYKLQFERYYNVRVKHERYKPGDLVLRRNEASRKENTEKMRPKWEGPYEVAEAHKAGSYKLKDMKGKAIPRHWNAVTFDAFTFNKLTGDT
jgi:hypothetical protein